MLPTSEVYNEHILVLLGKEKQTKQKNFKLRDLSSDRQPLVGEVSANFCG
jgi:hypothetical protein